MNEIASLLFANEAFYLAFTNRDFGAMDAIWAERRDVTCIHPGWDALSGREEVMESWRGILGGSSAPSIACRKAGGRIMGGLGMVLCYEQVGQNLLVATNLFVKDGTGWKMVHHQAGPCQITPAQLGEEPEAPSVQ